jgi:hypothetical protein
MHQHGCLPLTEAAWLAYVYYEDKPQRRAAAKLLTKGEACGPGLLRKPD